jgi:cysteinyl-tRNA synthetase
VHDSLTWVQLSAQLKDFGEEQKLFFNSICVALVDDLNTPAVLGLIFKELEKFQHWSEAERTLLATFVNKVLGLQLDKILLQDEVAPEVLELLELRTRAREAKDFVAADKIREELKAVGFNVADKKLDK